jgi:hypothetical protein
MFWLLYLMTRQRQPRRITVNHVRWKRPRFHNPWYWISTLAFLELAMWLVAFEIAGELLGIWWLAWWGYRAAVMAAGDRWSLAGGWYRVIPATRPVWPKQASAA